MYPKLGNYIAKGIQRDAVTFQFQETRPSFCSAVHGPSCHIFISLPLLSQLTGRRRFMRLSSDPNYKRIGTAEKSKETLIPLKRNTICLRLTWSPEEKWSSNTQRRVVMFASDIVELLCWHLSFGIVQELLDPICILQNLAILADSMPRHAR